MKSLCGVGQFHLELLFLQALLQVGNLQVDNLVDFTALSAGGRTQFRRDGSEIPDGTAVSAESLTWLLASSLMLPVGVDAFQNIAGAEVGGQDDDGVFEIDRAALRVGDAPVVQHLQAEC